MFYRPSFFTDSAATYSLWLRINRLPAGIPSSASSAFSQIVCCSARRPETPTVQVSSASAEIQPANLGPQWATRCCQDPGSSQIVNCSIAVLAYSSLGVKRLYTNSQVLITLYGIHGAFGNTGLRECNPTPCARSRPFSDWHSVSLIWVSHLADIGTFRGYDVAASSVGRRVRSMRSDRQASTSDWSQPTARPPSFIGVGNRPSVISW